jgi:hypothetical protein
MAFGRSFCGGLRLVMLRMLVATQAIELLLETLLGPLDYGVDLRSEGRRLIGCCGSLRCITATAASFNGGVDAVKLGGLDMPFTELISCGGDLAALDGLQDCPFIQAGRLCGCRESVRHALPIGSLNDVLQWCSARVAEVFKAAEILFHIGLNLLAEVCPYRQLWLDTHLRHAY